MLIKLTKGVALFIAVCMVLIASMEISIVPVSAKTQATYYVSPKGNDKTGNGSYGRPWKTIEKARNFVRTVNRKMKGDIIVYLRGDTYTLTSTITFNQSDSGTNGYNVIYKNYPKETPIISGGKRITGWKLYNRSKNIYKASNVKMLFRELYVNGSRAIRARYPNKASDGSDVYIQDGTWSKNGYNQFTVPNNIDRVKKWSGMNQIELVFVQHWSNMHMRMSSYTLNGSDAIISFQDPENTDPIVVGYPQNNTPHFYENSLDFLDAGGEWYLDTSKHCVYYKPRAGENISTAEIVAPNVETLIDFAGSSTTEMVHNIQFIGITIQYSNWILPSINGYLNWQAGYALNAAAGYRIPGALDISNANNITIQSCTFRRTAVHAIRALDDTTDCTFTRNSITDSGGGGIYLDLLNSTSTGNVINYNTIQSGGEVYTDAVGIFLAYSPYTTVQHNEVSDYRWVGISIGLNLDDSATAATNIDVSYNKIHDVMKLHDDGAGIYTNGKIPNCTIHDNYIYNLSNSSYSGGSGVRVIYLDGGSCFKKVYSNVLDNTIDAFLINYDNHDNTIRDNYYNGNLGTIYHMYTPFNIDYNNTYVDGEWPSDALKIMENAGTEGVVSSPPDLTDYATPTPEVTPAPTVTPVPLATCTPDPSSTSFVTSVKLSNTKYNDFWGPMGMHITVGSNPITVVSLGWMCISGNSRSHRLSIFDTSGTEIAYTSDISMSGGTPGQFIYGDLTSPTTLSANTTYYIVSQEITGDDYWYSNDNVAQTTAVAKCSL
jgi:hypothetical protein